MVAKTAFEKFLVNNDACLPAREFVRKRGGSFARAWEDCRDSSWRAWLANRLKNSGNDIGFGCTCSICIPDVSVRRATSREISRYVLAEARKRRWIK